MTVKEAEEILNIDTSVNTIAQVAESTNYYIFGVVPIDANGKYNRPLTPPIAVEKKTGKTLAFNPMHFSRDELKSVKRIR